MLWTPRSICSFTTLAVKASSSPVAVRISARTSRAASANLDTMVGRQLANCKGQAVPSICFRAGSRTCRPLFDEKNATQNQLIQQIYSRRFKIRRPCQHLLRHTIHTCVRLQIMMTDDATSNWSPATITATTTSESENVCFTPRLVFRFTLLYKSPPSNRLHWRSDTEFAGVLHAGSRFAAGDCPKTLNSCGKDSLISQ